jgi:glyoxylase-like metal-dependent hydrolase (beta-lactamase superfamily II)
VAIAAKILTSKQRKANRMTAKTIPLLAIIAGLAMTAMSDRIMAQNAQAQAGTTLITLGTAGGPVPRADRAQSSNLLIVNGTLYLIDAGGGVTGRVVQSGNNFRKVSKIFITHAHSDHTAGLATLLVSEWEQQAEPIDVAAASRRWSKARSIISRRTPRSAGPKARSGR